MTKIMMTGGSGRVGKELREYGVLPLVGDINSPEFRDTVLSEKPDIIVHLASVSDVDFCEDKKNTETVVSTNLVGTANVLDVAEEIGAKVILLSTDHVFGGGNRWFTKKGPYKETDTPAPVNFYGMSKMAAEGLQNTYDNLYVVRTSYLFNAQRLGYFDLTQPCDAPTFIYRSFMYLPHFVSNFYMYITNLANLPKLIHISGSETTSWYKFRKVMDKNIQPRRYVLENEVYAPRPLWGGLKTIYKSLFPAYSFMDGIEQMKKVEK